jgi:hypothetical protein
MQRHKESAVIARKGTTASTALQSNALKVITVLDQKRGGLRLLRIILKHINSIINFLYTLNKPVVNV